MGVENGPETYYGGTDSNTTEPNKEVGSSGGGVPTIEPDMGRGSERFIDKDGTPRSSIDRVIRS